MVELQYTPLLGWLAVASLMLCAWIWQRRSGNAGWVDVLWSATIGLLAIGYALVGEGWGPRRVLVALLLGGWSLRLTWHLARRVASEPEDGRYRRIREQQGSNINRFHFWFFQIQGLLAVGLSLVVLPLVSAEESGWALRDFVAVLLWITSIIGENLADRQLSAFRNDENNRGRTCRSGLWRYSRHPNYFFEWIHWLVYPTLGIGLAYGSLLWIGPALMLFLVLKVTGIPPTEEQSVASRGEDYRAYQRETNAFFPGPTRAKSVEPSPNA